MNAMPTFSIIIPVYNFAPYLRECLDSLLAQTFTDWEAICVDEGSTDGSSVILDEYTNNDGRFQVVHADSRNQATVKNLGIDKAHGEWIWFINYDTIIHPNGLAHVASILMNNSEIDAYAYAGGVTGEKLPETWPELPPANAHVTSEHGYREFMHFFNSSSNVIYRRERFLDHKVRSFSDGETSCLFSSIMFWNLATFALEDVPLSFCLRILCTLADEKVSKKIVKEDLIVLRSIIESIVEHGNWTKEELHTFLSRFQRIFFVTHQDRLIRLSDAELKIVLREWLALQTQLISVGGGMRYVPLATLLLKLFPSVSLARIAIRSILHANNRTFWQLVRCGAVKCWRKSFGRWRSQKNKTMRLGAAYNLFDGEELLAASIRSIRSNVDFVCVVYQDVSNSGEKRKTSLKPFLDDLVAESLIDRIVLFTPPKHLSRQECEKSKRLIGIEECKRNGCTHFLDMDTDEFYRNDEFRKAKEFIVANDIDVSAASIIEYVKSPRFRLVYNYMYSPCENPIDYVFYVPFICRITKKPFVGMFPCYVDPTRGIFRQGKFYLFSKHKIAMHHMSTVRKDLARKLRNSAQSSNLIFQQMANAIRDFDFAGSRENIPSGYGFIGRYLVEEVPNEFGIEI